MHFKHLHFYGGLVFLFVFIYSGSYMDSNYRHLADMPDLQRMIFRAEHIYLLLSSLIHIALGTHFKPLSSKILGYVQIFASVLMFAASFCFIYSFFTGMPTDIIERSVSRNGLYLMLAGVSFHGILSLVEVRMKV